MFLHKMSEVWELREMSDIITLEKRGRVGILKINRPPLNVLDSNTYEEMGRVLEELGQYDQVSVVVLTGEGERAFCAGADVHEFVSLEKVTGFYYSARNQAVRSQLWNLPQPVIAAINGLALGAGCVLAMLCDIRIACEEAKFGLGEINMGILGGTQIAARMLPAGIARRMVYTGEMISADEALRYNLADQILPRDKLMPSALDLAEKIAGKSPQALRYAKKLMVSSFDGSINEGLSEELKALRVLWGTEDKNEAVLSFLEKRAPVFKGS